MAVVERKESECADRHLVRCHIIAHERVQIIENRFVFDGLQNSRVNHGVVNFHRDTVFSAVIFAVHLNGGGGSMDESVTEELAMFNIDEIPFVQRLHENRAVEKTKNLRSE